MTQAFTAPNKKSTGTRQSANLRGLLTKMPHSMAALRVSRAAQSSNFKSKPNERSGCCIHKRLYRHVITPHVPFAAIIVPASRQAFCIKMRRRRPSPRHPPPPPPSRLLDTAPVVSSVAGRVTSSAASRDTSVSRSSSKIGVWDTDTMFTCTTYMPQKRAASLGEAVPFLGRFGG